MNLTDVLARAESLAYDPELKALAQWQAAGGRAVGFAPSYVPTELIDAARALPVALLGGGRALEVVQGDAFFQSAICHLPRSLMELGLRGLLNSLDLIVIPSTCDVLRNLSGMWKVKWPERRVHFFELPQRGDADGMAFYREQLVGLLHEIEQATGTRIETEALRQAIERGNRRRRLIAELFELRAAHPSRVPTSELYVVLRAGAALRPAQHIEILGEYVAACREAARSDLDAARVALFGAFCEQPPLGFLRTLERAGCSIVEDDLLLGLRWLLRNVDQDTDPLDALAAAYTRHSPPAPCRYTREGERTAWLLDAVRQSRAQGVILASPSFCDIALLDRPALLDAFSKANIPVVQLQYAENSVDFGAVREQAGTFADAVRLWEEVA